MRIPVSAGFIILLVFGGLMAHASTQVNSGDSIAIVVPANTSVDSQSTIIAKVNGQAITVDDISEITSGALKGITDPAIITRIKAQALNDLINGYLASDAFEKSPASKNLGDLKQIEHLKRQVVMNFYLSSNLAGMSKPDPRRIESYLQKHPELVGKRQTFHFSQILIDASKSVNISEVQSFVSQDPTLNKLLTYLQQNKVPNARNQFWRGTDQLNPATVAILNGLKKGGISVEQSTDQKGIAVIKLYEAYSDPVTMEQARETISTGAQEEMRNQIARDLLMGLRSKADIQIFDKNLEISNLVPSPNNNELLNEPKNRFLTKILIIWLFSLLIFIPAAVVVFYRQRIILELGSGSSLEELQDPEFLGYQKYTKLIRRLVVFLLLLPILYWLCMPLFDFFSFPPAEIGFQAIAMLAFSGLLFGVAVLAACIKIPQIYLRMKSGWLGLAILMGIELIFFWFGIHA